MITESKLKKIINAELRKALLESPEKNRIQTLENYPYIEISEDQDGRLALMTNFNNFGAVFNSHRHRMPTSVPTDLNNYLQSLKVDSSARGAASEETRETIVLIDAGCGGYFVPMYPTFANSNGLLFLYTQRSSLWESLVSANDIIEDFAWDDVVGGPIIDAIESLLADPRVKDVRTLRSTRSSSYGQSIHDDFDYLFFVILDRAQLNPNLDACFVAKRWQELYRPDPLPEPVLLPEPAPASVPAQEIPQEVDIDIDEIPAHGHIMGIVPRGRFMIQIISVKNMRSLRESGDILDKSLYDDIMSWKQGDDQRNPISDSAKDEIIERVRKRFPAGSLEGYE